jgi:Lon protease-like protein
MAVLVPRQRKDPGITRGATLEGLARPHYCYASRSGGYLSAERAEPTLSDISLHNLFCPLADTGQVGRVMASNQARSRSLPEKPSAEQLRKQAKDLARSEALQLAAAQRTLAREYGFKNWSELMRHVRSLSTASKAAHRPDDAIGKTAPEPVPSLKILLKRPVADLSLTMRALSGLQLKNIGNIADLIQYSERDLLEIRNFGRKSLNEIKDVLGKLGLSLATGLEVEKDLPFLPLRELIAFPHVVYPVFVGRPKSIKAIKSAVDSKLPIVMAAQKDPKVESPDDGEIYRVGVVGNLIKVADLPDGTLKALIECKGRVRVTQLIEGKEFITAKAKGLTEPVVHDLDKLLESVASAYVSSRYKSLAENRSVFANSRGNASLIADRIASELPIGFAQKQELLELLNPAERLDKLLAYLSSQMFAVGDEVKIVGGAFGDFEGKIEELRPSEGRALVAISIFGRSESVELDFSQIKAATGK